MGTMTNYVKQWLEFGDDDLASAEFLQKMYPIPINIVCYHCEQAAEKYLKGYMAYFGEGILKTHDLRILCKECGSINSSFSNIENQCARLTTFSTITRYPNEIQIDSSDMDVALRDARSIGNFIKEEIAKSENKKDEKIEEKEN